MQDHGDLVYLDVPKTGSTFVVAFLEASCRLPLLGGVRHAGITGSYRKDAYYFATVRHPVAQYVSLFRHGSYHMGRTRGRIERAGRGDVYEKGFDHWLAFVLDPDMAAVFGDGYENVVGSGIGVMTFRFVALSVADGMTSLMQARSVDDVRMLYDTHRLTQQVIPMEELNAGLRTLALSECPQWFDTAAAGQFLATSPRINASFRPGPNTIDPALEAEVMRRERLVIDLFYSGDPQPFGGQAI